MTEPLLSSEAIRSAHSIARLSILRFLSPGRSYPRAAQNADQMAGAIDGRKADSNFLDAQV